MPLIRLTAPSVEPVTLEEIKLALRVDYDDEDELIRTYIKAARQRLERRCGRAFVTQMWELRQSCFEDPIELPLRPVRSIGAITYIDEDGDTQTVDEDAYDFVDGGDDGASSVILIDEWPTDVFDRPDAVRIPFTAGYAPTGDSPTDFVGNVPEDLKQAIRWLVGHYYENRESVALTPTRQEFQEVPDTVVAMIAPYIVPQL